MIPTPVTDESIEHAADLLRQGRLVAFPTETVYGLGADASNPEAVSKIFVAKGRPADHPVIVHIATINELNQWVSHIPESALVLAQAFWPGPLTIIFNKKASVSNIVTGGQNTIALRIPGNPVALQLLTSFGGGIAAPSANRFGHVSPTLASHVAEEFGDSIDYILDGEACTVGIESTIIDLSTDTPTVLRPGRISISQLRARLQTEVYLAEKAEIRAPGMLAVHYAPETKAVLCDKNHMLNRYDEKIAQGNSVGVLTYSSAMSTRECLHQRQLPSKAKDYEPAIYNALRELDKLKLDIILIEQPPATEIWSAVNDRLRKATVTLA